LVYAHILENIGKAYEEQGKYSQAHENYKKALIVKEKT
jgi:tetratricopeptide (TPR) repeat protein